MGLGTGIILTLVFALVGAIVIMLISETGKDITLSLSEIEEQQQPQH